MATTSGRLLALLSLLQTRRDWPGALLADRLGVTGRTVRRDVDRLRELGYPIRAIKGPDGGYRLDAGATLPPLLFDDEQAVALAVALRLAAATGADVAADAARALATVRQLLPTRLRHRVDAVQVTVGSTTHGPADPDVLVALTTAIRAREELRFDHARTRRRVQPHHLVARGGRWYLVAWDLDRDDWRVFRADRITPRVPTGPRFRPREIPGGDVAAFVTARFRGGDADWPCRGTVVLHRPAGEVAPYVHDGVVEELGPDRCRLTLGSWSWTGLAASIARFDADLAAAGPPELRAACATLARRFAAAAEVSA
ncbi:helix-turn-helix transcriptional regulator [Jiangella anatolica]|uniref:Transcriptional regulator n=1 Tax=Jiangella anatolica TaxID=2670374 RepID=A0A2W2BWY9_9ACTN|nr:WYL domain-containing protein [Jiangella anatolica]PZF80137.1 transcriptional regulator [Jiangella anatolica]